MTMNNDLLKKFGLQQEKLVMLGTIDDLRNSVPGMVFAEALNTFSFSINYGKPITWNKKEVKLVSLYLYQSLAKDPKTNITRLRPYKTKFRDIYRPYTGQDLTNKKIIIWRTGGIGDLCFINPLIRYMKNKWPSCTIYFSCSPIYMDLINVWPWIDSVVAFPISHQRIVSCNYHVTFEGVIERCKEAEYTNSYELFSKWLNLDVDRNELYPIIFTTEEDDNVTLNFLQDNSIKPYEYITVQLRASSPIRTPSTECWSNILVPLLKNGHKIILTDSPKLENNLNAFINIAIPDSYKSQVYNYCKYSTDIRKTISLLKYAAMAIAPDSSCIHLSQGIGCPVLGIYGAFSGDIRMSTYRNADWVEPIQNDICSYGGKHCFTHGTVCSMMKERNINIALCYNYLDYEEVYSKAIKLYKAREIPYFRQDNRILVGDDKNDKRENRE